MISMIRAAVAEIRLLSRLAVGLAALLVEIAFASDLSWADDDRALDPS